MLCLLALVMLLVMMVVVVIVVILRDKLRPLGKLDYIFNWNIPCMGFHPQMSVIR